MICALAPTHHLSDGPLLIREQKVAHAEFRSEVRRHIPEQRHGEGRLAGATLTDNPDSLAFTHSNIDPINRLYMINGPPHQAFLDWKPDLYLFALRNDRRIGCRRLLSTRRLRAEKRLEQHRKRAAEAAEAARATEPEDMHKLDLTDNTSMMSGSYLGITQLGVEPPPLEYHDNRRIYRDQPDTPPRESQPLQQPPPHGMGRRYDYPSPQRGAGGGYPQQQQQRPQRQYSRDTSPAAAAAGQRQHHAHVHQVRTVDT